MAEYLEATLGALALEVELLADWGSVTREADESENVYADIATQLNPRTSALRKPALQARLIGTDKDDLIAKEDVLRKELGKPTNTLVVRPKDATNAITFVLLYNPVAIADFDYLYEEGCEGTYLLNLIAEPWGYGDSETVFAAQSETSPALVSLGSLLGDGDPRLRLTVTRDWSGASNGMQFVCAALCTGGTTVDDYVYEAEDSALSGPWYDYDGNANCHGGHSARLDAADSDAWEHLGAVVPAPAGIPGRYRVWARAVATDGDEGYLAKRKQYSAVRDPSTVVTLDDGALAWYDLGEWIHYGSDALELFGKAVTGGIYVDRVLMVPVDWGWVWYTDRDEETDSVTFGWLYDHKYATVDAPTVPIDACARMQGHGLKAPREDFDLLVFVEPHGSDPDPSMVLDGSYISRWEMFR